MRTAVVGIVVGLVAITAAPAQADYMNTGAKRCAWVSFEANSDAGARPFARGTTCRVARKLVRDYWADATGAVPRYQLLDLYRCKSRVRQAGHAGNGIAHTDVRCTRGSKKVITFAVS